MMNQKSLLKKGFTLVELIIVIAIIAILAVTAFLYLAKWLGKARDSARSADISTLIKSSELVLLEKNALPMPSNYTGVTDVFGGIAWYQGTFDSSVAEQYGNLSNTNIKDPSGNLYGYSLAPDKKHYQFKAEMENEVSYINNDVFADDKIISLKGNYNGYLIANTGYIYTMWNSPSLFIGSGTVLDGYNNIFEDGKTIDNNVALTNISVNELFVGGNAKEAIVKISNVFGISEEQALSIVGNIAGGGAGIDGNQTASSFYNLAIADGHMCGIKKSDGLAYCWGWNLYGQLGNGTTGPYSLIPVKAGSGDFINILAGQTFTCGTKKSDGLIYCWGRNGDGQLGNGTTTDAYSPTKVGSGNFTSIVVGRRHACGINKNDGLYYCRGWNYLGQLGDGTTTDSSTPKKLFNNEYTDLKLGAYNTCGKNKNDGVYYCWGGNEHGELGNETLTNSPTPIKAGNDNFISLTIGRGHMCGIKKSDGLAYCWGNNDYGQLGDNSTATSQTPIKLGSGDFINLTASSNNTCGIKTSDGLVYCWGLNTLGQLGNGNTTNSLIPIKAGNGDYVSYIFNYNTMCAIKKSDGKMYCWGRNDLNQIGNGTLVDALSPILKN